MENILIPTLPLKKEKNYAGRLADALGYIKLSKDLLTKEYDRARDLAIELGKTELTGERWQATIADIETSRIDMEKLEKFLAKHNKTTDDFKTTSLSSRLTIKTLV